MRGATLNACGPVTSGVFTRPCGSRLRCARTRGPHTQILISSHPHKNWTKPREPVRPKEGVTPEIKDSYEYNGEGLRTSQTINGTTTYLAWDTADALPLILDDGTNSYIYGPGDLPVEQINNTTGSTMYLHHDQQGSTRLITGITGTVEGKCTYGAYGTPTCEGAATTPLGYDGQYTNSNTGLIYLRARYYDPTTGQFLTADPQQATATNLYEYATDNPLSLDDPTGEKAKRKRGVWTIVKYFKVKPERGRRSQTVLRVGSPTWGQTHIQQKHPEITDDAIATALSNPTTTEQHGETTTYAHKEREYELVYIGDAPVPIWRTVETRVVVNRETAHDGEDAGIITAYQKRSGPFNIGESPQGPQA